MGLGRSWAGKGWLHRERARQEMRQVELVTFPHFITDVHWAVQLLLWYVLLWQADLLLNRSNSSWALTPSLPCVRTSWRWGALAGAVTGSVWSISQKMGCLPCTELILKGRCVNWCWKVHFRMCLLTLLRDHLSDSIWSQQHGPNNLSHRFGFLQEKKSEFHYF